MMPIMPIPSSSGPSDAGSRSSDLNERGGTGRTASGLWQEIRHTLRTLARAPGFTAAALLSLALGVGANTFIFSVASALLLRPLPYADADRLAILWNRSPGLGIAEDWFSTAQYVDVKTRHQGLAQVALAIGSNENLTGDGEPERIGTIRVSSNLLPMLGVRAGLGRLFVEADDREGAAPTALLAHGTWIRRYGGDPRVVGRSIVVNGQAYQIVGVLPASFSLPREVMPTLGGAEHAELLLPLPLGPKAPETRTHEDYNILAQVKPGVSFDAAQAEMDTLTAALRRDHPDFYPPNSGLTFSIVPLQEQVVGTVRRSLLLLIGAVGFVLLIACANVANLLLSRGLARQREIAVRVALGASRGRIVRLLLTESVLLAIGGGTLGVLLSLWGLQWIRILGSKSVPRLHEIGIDGRVLLFTLALSVGAGILFGLAPALRLSRLDVHRNLKDSSRGSSGASAVWGRGQNVRRLLVMSQLALSIVLLIGAGLLIRSFTHLQRVTPGFDASRLLTLELTMNGRRYDKGSAVREAYRQLWPRLDRLPGVAASGGVSALPLSQMFAWGPITVEGRTPPAGEKFINADMRMIGGRYFETMRIPLLKGRVFTDQDTQTTPRVAIVDEHMANQLWPNADPIGKRLRTGGSDSTTPWLTIVGVVGRVKQYTLDADSRIAMYFPHEQFSVRAMNIVLRTDADPAALTGVVKREIEAMDPDLPMYGVRTMEQRVEESLAGRRFSMLLLTLFASLALGIATIGIYGVLAYLVAQGSREIGIRLALGATSGGILLLVIRQGMTVAVAGVAIGVGVAFVLTRFMTSLLFGVDAADPATFVAIPLLLSLVALIASWVPARRAARIDPMMSLRSE
jgi:predicted permease